MRNLEDLAGDYVNPLDYDGPDYSGYVRGGGLCD